MKNSKDMNRVTTELQSFNIKSTNCILKTQLRTFKPLMNTNVKLLMNTKIPFTITKLNPTAQQHQKKRIQAKKSK